MTKNTVRTKSNNRKFLIPWMLVVVLLAGGFGYYYWSQNNNTRLQQQATSVVKTAQVRQGDITVSASGTGTLVASRTQSLSFSTAGTVATVRVQIGDQVTQGQVLAQLENITTLQAEVNSAQQDLISAQQALDTLKKSGPANIGNAQLAVANAQQALTKAKSGYIAPGAMRCDQTTTDAYYSKYMIAQQQLDALGNGNGNQEYYLTTIVPARNNMLQAYQAYKNCAGFTSYETDASHAQLSLSQANLKTAQENLDLLQKNNGVNPTDLADAENKVSSAQIALDQAKSNLDGATLKAPFAGTVTAVSGAAGDSVNPNTTFVSISDLAHPQIQFAVDETDLDKVAMNEEAVITFDAMPNATFNGKVTQINPSLVTANGYQTVQGWIQLDLSKEKNPPVMLAGMTSSVQLIKAQAKNVLIIPSQAIRDLGGGQFGVFVVGSQGKLQLRIVQVGLIDSTNAEIKSGLTAGQQISTGASQVK